jgi:hypothetical protein
MSLLHLVIPAPRLPQRDARASAITAVALHIAAAAVLAMLTMARTPEDLRIEATNTAPVTQLPRMVFLQMPGPGGGGGGGGNRNPSPPSRAENVGRDDITLPVARPVRAARDPAEAIPVQSVALDAIPLASGVAYRMGTPSAAPFARQSSGGSIPDVSATHLWMFW